MPKLSYSTTPFCRTHMVRCWGPLDVKINGDDKYVKINGDNKEKGRHGYNDSGYTIYLFLSFVGQV